MFVLALKWRIHQHHSIRGPNKILFTDNDIIPTKKSEVSRSDYNWASTGSIQTLDSHGHHHARSVAHKNSLVADNVARYNGELVHMRFLPIAPYDHFEIKSKALAVLSTVNSNFSFKFSNFKACHLSFSVLWFYKKNIQMRTLRNENVNNLLGCYCSERRPAMIFEFCSRGSLIDILKCNDITLDWPFRLSLLTDLVRVNRLIFIIAVSINDIKYAKYDRIYVHLQGMRYLHNSPVHCHGKLSSRNCVVDSRWVDIYIQNNIS